MRCPVAGLCQGRRRERNIMVEIQKFDQGASHFLWLSGCGATSPPFEEVKPTPVFEAAFDGEQGVGFGFRLAASCLTKKYGIPPFDQAIRAFCGKKFRTENWTGNSDSVQYKSSARYRIAIKDVLPHQLACAHFRPLVENDTARGSSYRNCDPHHHLRVAKT